MPQAPTTRREIPSTIADALAVVREILARTKAAGYDDAEQFAIRLALDEAVSNAIRHGNRNEPQRQVVIEYAIDPQTARITITDEGAGFSPDDVPDPTADENLERPHGRGVMLMRAYMNEVKFNERGNRVTMVKHRTSQKAARTGT